MMPGYASNRRLAKLNKKPGYAAAGNSLAQPAPPLLTAVKTHVGNMAGSTSTGGKCTHLYSAEPRGRTKAPGYGYTAKGALQKRRQ